MPRLSTLLSISATLALTAQAATIDTAVVANGVCIYGTCSLASLETGAIGTGANTSGSFSSPITVGTDTYALNGTYQGSYNGLLGAGTLFYSTVSLVYTGASPSTSNDTIQIDLFEAIYDPSPGNWNGLYSESAPVCFSGSVGAGSSATAQFFVQGSDTGQVSLGVGLLGPYGSGCATLSSSAVLGTVANPISGNYLLEDWQFIFTMDQGTAPGGGGTTNPPSSVPEPAETLPAGVAVSGCLAYVIFRKRT